MEPQQKLMGAHAIVLGASIGGLLAARALSDYYERVTVLDRDFLPDDGSTRRGVPQGKHAHALLVRGLEIVQEWFPGIMDDFIAQGAIYGDLAERMRFHSEGGFHQVAIMGKTGICLSRPRIEAAIRRRAMQVANLRIIDGCDVLALEHDTTRSRVTGVRCQLRTGARTIESLAGDLVVDATGRGSRSPVWLESHGYARPQEESVLVDLAYASRSFRRRPSDLPGVNALVISAEPPNRRGGVILAQEGDIWTVTIGGWLGDHPPLDLAGFLDFARSMPSSAIYEAIKDAEPVGEPAAFKVPSNLRRRYERLERFPQGYLVFGDALCSFNPIYGQGMTVAAKESVALWESLAAGEEGLAQRFLTAASRIIDVPWSTAVGSDLRFAEVEGKRTLMTRFVNWYVSKLHRAAHRDGELSLAFIRVLNMTAEPPSILAPAIVWRVVRGNLHWGQGAAPKPVTGLATPVPGSVAAGDD